MFWALLCSPLRCVRALSRFCSAGAVSLRSGRLRSFLDSLAHSLAGKLEQLGDDVLIAVFHPQFEFGGLEDEEEVLFYPK